MRNTERFARQSDPDKNGQFNRFRPGRAPLRARAPAPATDADAEPGMATLLRWRAEWRARRAMRPSRQETAR